MRHQTVVDQQSTVQGPGLRGERRDNTEKKKDAIRFRTPNRGRRRTKKQKAKRCHLNNPLTFFRFHYVCYLLRRCRRHRNFWVPRWRAKKKGEKIAAKLIKEFFILIIFLIVSIFTWTKKASRAYKFQPKFHVLSRRSTCTCTWTGWQHWLTVDADRALGFAERVFRYAAIIPKIAER